MILDPDFLHSMQMLFARANMEDVYPSFEAALKQTRWKRAYRCQTRRIMPEQLAAWLSQEEGIVDRFDYLRSVPWSQDGFYIPEGSRPGQSLAYRLGLIYIQEASAMLPAEVLQARPGQMILDMCAAPGGKSSQTAVKLNGRGILIANDISETRARVLQRNLEQQGLNNCLVIHADPAKDLPASWNAVFDGIQLDAPCSGEGMFRRDPKAIESWQNFGPHSIRPIQQNLLEAADRLLKPGGRLVYSTCTFNSWENEELITAFLCDHKDYVVLDPRAWLAGTEGLSSGLVFGSIHPELHKAVRIWPHSGWGEGHFCVCLQKGPLPAVSWQNEFNNTILTDGLSPEGEVKSPWYRFDDCVKNRSKAHNNRDKQSRKARETIAVKKERGPEIGDAINAWKDFIKNYLLEDLFMIWARDRVLRLHNNWLYLLPSKLLPLEGIHALKTGTFLGELKKHKGSWILQPSHAFLLELPLNYWRHRLEWQCTDNRVSMLLSGLTLTLKEEEVELFKALPGKAYVTIGVNGYPLSFAQLNGSMLKNLYPPGWVRE